jgi:hypothetical protein
VGNNDFEFIGLDEIWEDTHDSLTISVREGSPMNWNPTEEPMDLEEYPRDGWLLEYSRSGQEPMDIGQYLREDWVLECNQTGDHCPSGQEPMNIEHNDGEDSGVSQPMTNEHISNSNVVTPTGCSNQENTGYNIGNSNLNQIPADSNNNQEPAQFFYYWMLFNLFAPGFTDNQGDDSLHNFENTGSVYQTSSPSLTMQSSNARSSEPPTNRDNVEGFKISFQLGTRARQCPFFYNLNQKTDYDWESKPTRKSNPMKIQVIKNDGNIPSFHIYLQVLDTEHRSFENMRDTWCVLSDGTSVQDSLIVNGNQKMPTFSIVKDCITNCSDICRLVALDTNHQLLARKTFGFTNGGKDKRYVDKYIKYIQELNNLDEETSESIKEFEDELKAWKESRRK